MYKNGFVLSATPLQLPLILNFIILQRKRPAMTHEEYSCHISSLWKQKYKSGSVLSFTPPQLPFEANGQAVALALFNRSVLKWSISFAMLKTPFESSQEFWRDAGTNRKPAKFIESVYLGSDKYILYIISSGFLKIPSMYQIRILHLFLTA